MSLLFKVLFLFMCSEFLYPGTVYLSKSIDEVSLFKVKDQDEIVENDVSFTSHSLGYYDTVWEKRKVDYTINLGLEFLHAKVQHSCQDGSNEDLDDGSLSDVEDDCQRGAFNIITFYSMFNYKFNKSIFSTLYVGIDFYNQDWDESNNQIYLPETKGGPMYGIGFTYILNKKFPLSLDYKVYTFSNVSNDYWKENEYKRAGISLGYKF